MFPCQRVGKVSLVALNCDSCGRERSRECVKIIVSFSDGTLNPNGVRFGSAEIYQVGECVSGLVSSEQLTFTD